MTEVTIGEVVWREGLGPGPGTNGTRGLGKAMATAATVRSMGHGA